MRRSKRGWRVGANAANQTVMSSVLIVIIIIIMAAIIIIIIIMDNIIMTGNYVIKSLTRTSYEFHIQTNHRTQQVSPLSGKRELLVL